MVEPGPAIVATLSVGNDGWINKVRLAGGNRKCTAPCSCHRHVGGHVKSVVGDRPVFATVCARESYTAFVVFDVIIELEFGSAARHVIDIVARRMFLLYPRNTMSGLVE